MGVFNGMFPIQAGKEEDARAFAAETFGARRADFEAQLARVDITRETWAVQETPMGSLMLVWFEGDVEKAFTDLATDDTEFMTWFRAQVLDVTGVDLAAPPDGPPPRSSSTTAPEQRWSVYAATERAGLSEFLDLQREALIETLRGVSDEDARRTPTVSTLSLLSLVKHSAIWERRWFQVVVAGRNSAGRMAGGAVRQTRTRFDSPTTTPSRALSRTTRPDRRLAGDPQDVRSRHTVRMGVGSEPAVGGGAHDRGDRSPRWPRGHHSRDHRRQPRVVTHGQGDRDATGGHGCWCRRSFDGVCRRARTSVRPAAGRRPAPSASDRSRAARSIPAEASSVVNELWSLTGGPWCRPTTHVGLESFGRVPAGETRWIITQMGPGLAAPMHSTPTIDYGLVVTGDVELGLEDGSAHLHAGDSVVVNGVEHSGWPDPTAV